MCGPGMKSLVPYIFFESKQQHRELDNLQDTETEAQGDKNPHRSQNLSTALLGLNDGPTLYR